MPLNKSYFYILILLIHCYSIIIVTEGLFHEECQIDESTLGSVKFQKNPCGNHKLSAVA